MNPQQQPDLLSLLAATSAAQPSIPIKNPQVSQPIDLVALFDDQPAAAPVVQAPPVPQNPVEILTHLCSQLPPEDHPLLRNLYRQVMEKKIPKQLFLQKTKELFAKKKMQALAMASAPAKRFNDSDPSANKKHKMERSSSNPYLEDHGRGQFPDWALKNRGFPAMNPANPLVSAASYAQIGSPASRPSSAGSSINVSQEIDLAPSNDKGNKDSEVSKLDVDSMMDATTYGGVDLKEEEYSLNIPAYGQSSGVAMSSKETSFLNLNRLKKEIQTLVSASGMTNVDSRILNYISQAAEIRIHTLVAAMIKTSQHRTGILTSNLIKKENDSNSEYKFEVVTSADKYLEKLEAEEREMETELKSDVQAQSEDFVATQKSKKQDIPESVKTKMINSTALRAAGGTMKSWMLPTGDASGSGMMLKTGFPMQKKSAAEKRKEMAKAKQEDPALKGMRITQKDRITLKDAVLVVERDPILSKSSIYYKWLSNLR